jgi:hypothetical protein
MTARHGVPGPVAAKRQRIRNPGRRDAGHRVYAADQPIIKRDLLRICRVFPSGVDLRPSPGPEPSKMLNTLQISKRPIREAAVLNVSRPPGR